VSAAVSFGSIATTLLGAGGMTVGYNVWADRRRESKERARIRQMGPAEVESLTTKTAGELLRMASESAQDAHRRAALAETRLDECEAESEKLRAEIRQLHDEVAALREQIRRTNAPTGGGPAGAPGGAPG
jgi:cell division protein FtsB